MTNRQRLQWVALLTPVAVLFSAAIFVVLINKPREFWIGKFSGEESGLQEAMLVLQREAAQHPYAASLTVHFRGPHEVPNDVSSEEVAEEIVTYNRRLGVLLVYVNRQQGAGGNWAFVKIACSAPPAVDLLRLSKRPATLLHDPAGCGCRVVPIRHST